MLPRKKKSFKRTQLKVTLRAFQFSCVSIILIENYCEGASEHTSKKKSSRKKSSPNLSFFFLPQKNGNSLAPVATPLVLFFLSLLPSLYIFFSQRHTKCKRISFFSASFQFPPFYPLILFFMLSSSREWTFLKKRKETEKKYI